MNKITLALPSKGAIAEPTLDFLKEAGLRVYKPNDRQYTGSIPAIPQIEVLFQRVKDVVYKVADGTAQLGVTGLDVVFENPSDDLIVIHPALGYGHCQLIIAVPEAWIDVETVADLADVVQDFRDLKGRNLRVATTYPSQTRQFFHAQGIHHFTIVRAEGAIEAAPTIGYADIVVDLTQTGTTLRENHLKPLVDGTITEAQACLIGNRQALLGDPLAREVLRPLVEHIDAALQGKQYQQITINMSGADPETVARRIVENPVTRGLQGPTVAPIYSSSGDPDGRERWFTVTLMVRSKDLLAAVDYLRSLGGRQVTVTPVRFVFLEESATYRRLLELLG